MKKGWLLLILVGIVATLVWLLAEEKIDTAGIRSALGLKSASAPAKSKPICSQVVVPAGDCIPQHLAHLPPDPGPAGKQTIEGIDADQDGVRDDVQRFIAEQWGHSERAVRALSKVAKGAQRMVLYEAEPRARGSRDEQHALLKELVSDPVACYWRSVDEKTRDSSALDRVVAKVWNTPERHAKQGEFEALIGAYAAPAPDEAVETLCGYNPAALAN